MGLSKILLYNEILKNVTNSTNGNNTIITNYWGFQAFTSITSTHLTITQNENADTLQTNITENNNHILNNTAVITDIDGNPVYIGQNKKPVNMVKITEQLITAVTLSAIPHNDYAPFKIWFIIRGYMPKGAVEAPKFVKEQRIEFMESVFVNQFGDTMYGALNMNTNHIYNLPSPTNPSEPARKSELDTKAPLKDYPLRWIIDAFVPGNHITTTPSTNGHSIGDQVAVNDWGDENNGNIYKVTNSDTWELLEEAFKGLGVIYRPTLIDYYYAGENDNSWWNDNLVNKQDKITSANNDEIQLFNANGNAKRSNVSFEASLTNSFNKVPRSSAVYAEITAHIFNTNNPHNTTLEQVRSQDNQIEGPIDFNENEALNLPQPTTNGEPIIFGNNGDVFFHDLNRDKILSISTIYLRYARNSSSITSSQFLRMINGMATNQNSDRLFWDATLVGAVLSHRDTGASWDLQVRKNGNSTNIYTLNLGTSDLYNIDNNINIDFDAGDLIQIRLRRISGTIRYPVVQLLFRRRK